MQTVFKAADAADFLALVPALAGYRPVDSVALVLFRGTRTAGVIRLDLGAFRDPLSVDSSAATAVGLACKVDRVDGVAVDERHQLRGDLARLVARGVERAA